ncbi:hypothetical protein HS088_TW12G00103 [Tripterygium wilfordii]|uniref:F-box domain-containing protein n=1 Tax=Tripterygium wilfordii TaxID=458696 RepID=A0A7J7CXR8_TRIWF|nr:F-box/kelch-repeat protein OR23-like [Tripterygium wilfordii]KAF5738907.1 hypothetical protein HS088_TW12G00103 [Tripterygium wilfordii]
MARPSSSSSAVAPELQLRIEEKLALIPGLPNDVAAKILFCVPYSHVDRLKVTCKSWRHFFSSKTLIRLRNHHRNLSSLLCIFPQDPSIASPYIFDPENLAWRPLPPMPCSPHVYGLCNFTSLAVGTNLYVLGGSLFDTRSFPLERPCSSSAAFRFDFLTFKWHRLAPMLYPRGSFACAAIPSSDQIIVAGGGSRHNLFCAAGSRMSAVERYDIERDEWVALDGLPSFRAGCVGFFVGEGEEREFWVMGGYGESRTLSGVFPVDEYYRDAVAMELKSNGAGKWREVGDMWAEGERARLGKIVVMEDEESGCRPSIFMLDGNEILRYDMASNHWQKESSVPRKASRNSSFGFVVLGGELYVMSQRWRPHTKTGTLFVQIYHPRKNTWRSLLARPPFHCPLDFKTAILCTVRL